MTASEFRQHITCDGDAPVPPLVQYAVLWIINAEKTDAFFSGN